MKPPSEQPLTAINAPVAQASPLGERHAATPRLACEALTRAINAGDLEAALALFAPNACLIGPDGKAAHGREAIRAQLGELVSRDAQLEIEVLGVLVADDLALAHERWQTSSEEALGRDGARAPYPTLVLRLTRGEWKLAIAAPWGAPAKAPLKAIWP